MRRGGSLLEASRFTLQPAQKPHWPEVIAFPLLSVGSSPGGTKRSRFAQPPLEIFSLYSR